jgi:hypothetical protein
MVHGLNLNAMDVGGISVTAEGGRSRSLRLIAFAARLSAAIAICRGTLATIVPAIRAILNL